MTIALRLVKLDAAFQWASGDFELDVRRVAHAIAIATISTSLGLLFGIGLVLRFRRIDSG